MRRMHRVVFAAALVSLSIFSCSNPASENDTVADQLTQVPPRVSPTPVTSSVPPLPDQTPAPSPQAAPQAPAPAAAPAAEPPQAPAHDPNMAPNGSFEEKDETGRPRGWAVSPMEILAKAEGAPVHGQHYLSINGVDDSWGILSCNLPVSDAHARKPIRVEAWGKAPTSNAMRLSVLCAQNGQEVELNKKAWPASPDEWTKLDLVVNVPDGADKDSLKLKILIPQSAGPGFALDNVHVTPDLLGDNASLEQVDDTGRPRGWIVSPADIISQEKTPPYDGHHALTVSGKADTYGIIAHNVAIAPEDLGKTLVVSAWIQSNDPQGIRMAIEAKKSGETITLGGDNWVPGQQWTQAVVRVELPKDIDPDSVQFRMITKPGNDTRHALDFVQANLE